MVFKQWFELGEINFLRKVSEVEKIYIKHPRGANGKNLLESFERDRNRHQEPETSIPSYLRPSNLGIYSYRIYPRHYSPQ